MDKDWFLDRDCCYYCFFCIFLPFWWMGYVKRKRQCLLVKNKNELFKISIVSAIVCGLALLYFFVDARYSNFFPGCPFFTLTGLYCPGCGSQRAVSALLHGDIIKAASYNVMFAASLAVVFYSASISVFNLFSANPIAQKILYSPRFVKILLVVVVLFWILRNIPAYPFTLLAP